eukprot:m.3628 g.3628  ORF g.3628 m.3628 type:complete len:421 (-) comp2510_c0_seq1:293-1555(-)
MERFQSEFILRLDWSKSGCDQGRWWRRWLRPDGLSVAGKSDIRLHRVAIHGHHRLSPLPSKDPRRALLAQAQWFAVIVIKLRRRRWRVDAAMPAPAHVTVRPSAQQELRDIGVDVRSKRELCWDPGEDRLRAAGSACPCRARRGIGPRTATPVPERRGGDIICAGDAFGLVQPAAGQVGGRAPVAVVGVEHAVEATPGESASGQDALQGLLRGERPIPIQLLHHRRVGRDATVLADEACDLRRPVQRSPRRGVVVLGVPVVNQVTIDSGVRHPHLAQHVLLHEPLAQALVAMVEHVVAARNDVPTVVAVLGPATLGVEEVRAQRLVQPRVELAAWQRGLRPKPEPPPRVRGVFQLLTELPDVCHGLYQVAVDPDLRVGRDGLHLHSLVQHHRVAVFGRVVPPDVFLRLKVQRDDPPRPHE